MPTHPQIPHAFRKDIVIIAAQAAHEVNRVYCLMTGDLSQLGWFDAPAWQRDAAVAGAEAVLDNPDRTPEQSHEAWFEHKKSEGWTWGPVKDPEAKTHPCMVPFEELPFAQQAKDILFVTTVKGVAGHLMSHPTTAANYEDDDSGDVPF